MGPEWEWLQLQQDAQNAQLQKKRRLKKIRNQKVRKIIQKFDHGAEEPERPYLPLEAALCKSIFALSKMDLMNVGCSSRRIWAVMEKHSAESAQSLSPFSIHSMLRFRRFARIVHVMCPCLPETIQPSRPHLQLHTLRPYLQLRTTCRWIFQAMHAPMKIQVGALFVQLGELHAFQSDLLHRLTRLNIHLENLANFEQRTVETVRRQYMQVRQMHDAYNEAAFFDLKSVLGGYAC